MIATLGAAEVPYRTAVPPFIFSSCSQNASKAIQCSIRCRCRKSLASAALKGAIFNVGINLITTRKHGIDMRKGLPSLIEDGRLFKTSHGCCSGSIIEPVNRLIFASIVTSLTTSFPSSAATSFLR